MKNTSALSAAILTLLVSTATPAQPPRAGHGMAPEQRVERMTEILDLTPEQQTEIHAIFETQRMRRKAERAAIREQVDAVLTEEQRAERDARIDQRIERRVARMADRLDLTPEQETELRAVMAEKRSDPTWDRSEMRERLSAMLTADQMEKLDDMRSHPGRRYQGGCKE